MRWSCSFELIVIILELLDLNKNIMHFNSQDVMWQNNGWFVQAGGNIKKANIKLYISNGRSVENNRTSVLLWFNCRKLWDIQALVFKKKKFYICCTCVTCYLRCTLFICLVSSPWLQKYIKLEVIHITMIRDTVKLIVHVPSRERVKGESDVLNKWKLLMMCCLIFHFFPYRIWPLLNFRCLLTRGLSSWRTTFDR